MTASRSGWGPLSRFGGMGRFSIIWCGQVVTLVGNAVLRFAFVVHAWTTGQQATNVVLLSLCGFLPQVLLSPTAGALVDRCRKKTALRLTDGCGLVVVGALTAGYFAGTLTHWEMYVTTALLGAAAAFGVPALSSAVPLLVREDQLQRANGLLATATSGSEVCGPALAGVLLAVSGFGVILVVDLVTFGLALGSVWLVRIPEPRRTAAEPDGPKPHLLADSLAGLRYLYARPSLRALTIVFVTANFAMVFGYSVVEPMILARTGDNASALAVVLTAIGIGGIAGGLLLAAWGGPASKARGMLYGTIGMCLTSQIAMACVRGTVAWSIAIVAGALLMPVINGTMQAIIQTKTPPEMQGRVFGAEAFLSQASVPLAMACAGPLADHLFEPEARSGTGLVGLLRPLIGSGAGAGMATMLLLAGVFGTLAALAGLASRSVRDLDRLLPDLVPPEPEPSEAH